MFCASFSKGKSSCQICWCSSKYNPSRFIYFSVHNNSEIRGALARVFCCWHFAFLQRFVIALHRVFKQPLQPWEDVSFPLCKTLKANRGKLILNALFQLWKSEDCNLDALLWGSFHNLGKLFKCAVLATKETYLNIQCVLISYFRTQLCLFNPLLAQSPFDLPLVVQCLCAISKK